MRTILLTDGEFTGMIRTLRSLEEEVRIIGFVSSPVCAHVTMLDRFYVAPDWRDESYTDFLVDVIKKNGVDLVFPVITSSLEFMAGIRDSIFEKTGARVVISSPESIRIANNKARLFEAMSEACASMVTPFETAETFGELKQAVNKFTDNETECISKPVCGENAEGFVRFTDDETYAVKALEGNGSKLMPLSVMQQMEDTRALQEERLVMPFLPGDEWDVDVLAWNGKIIAATVRKNLDMFGGLSACTSTHENDKLIGYCEQIVKTLKLDYLSCISFKEDAEGNPKLLEINPRSMGSIHLSTMCGNNLVQQLLDFTDLSPKADQPCDEMRLTSPGITASLYYDLTIVEPKPVIWNTICPPDYEIYESYYKKVSSRITDIVFNCRFAWDSMYHFKWAIIEDCFVQISFGSQFSNPFMLMPLGEFDSEKLSKIVSVVKREFDQRGLDFTIYGIGEEYVPEFEKITVPHGEIYFNDDFSDYLYNAEDLRSLAGRNYSKKRNHIHKFEKENPGSVYESLKPEHFSQCLELTSKWEEAKGVDSSNMEESDFVMIKNMFDNWERLNARGGVIKIDGQIEAFSIGSLEGDTAYIHFEKANAEIDGIYAEINKLVQMNEFPEAVYVNREEDLGIPGLRQAKRSYFPVSMVRKYKMDIL